jgi:hypothetical protein
LNSEKSCDFLDVTEYISTGILEAYVTGTASEQEMQEVECMSHIYPEVAVELEKVQLSMESYVQAHSIQPPENVKQSVLDSINNLDVATSESSVEQEDTPVIPVNINRNNGSNKIFFYVAAASLVGLIAMAVLFYNTSEKLDLTNQIVVRLSKERDKADELKKQLDQQSIKMASLEAKYESMVVVKTSDLVVLKGVETKMPEGSAAVLWDKESGMVQLNPGSLPAPVTGKQYQLWAIVDGAPVDMGVFNISDREKLIEMTVVSNATAFAITLENEGGVPSPTMEEMYVIGTV